jgi:hypothetical protein
MRQGRRWRAWVGVVAAYALALQTLLTAVVATKMAAASSDSFTICLANSDQTGDQHQPTGAAHPAHQNCIICSHASTAAVPPSPVTIAFAWIGEATVSWQMLRAPASLSKQRSPQVPQGPPQIA